MLLPPEDAALFYRAFGAILTWVNKERNVVPPFPAPSPDHPIDPELANQVRKVLWAEDELRERFLAEHPHLPEAERALIGSWRHRVSGNFLVERHLKKHSIFMEKEVYAVLGLYTPLEELIPYVPAYVRAVLLPFRDVIITDGLLETGGPFITFGGGAKRMFREEYSRAGATGRIVTKLPADLPPPVSVPQARRPPRKKRRR